MNIAKDTVALLHYELKNDSGEVLDTSSGKAPLAYLHGHGNLVPGLEAELEGKSGGDSFKASIAPEQGYGVRHEAMVQQVERSRFPEGAQIHPGVQFQAQTPQGPHVVTVVKVEDDSVTIDGNHPLAGETLHFDVKVVEVRAATEEELAHGHVHGAGGHAH